MTAFWQERTPREQWLIGLAGAILIAVLAYQAVYAPLLRYRESAERSYQAAFELFEEVSAGAEEAAFLRQLGEQAGAAEGQTVRTIAGAGARQLGVAITRLQPADRDGLTLWIDSVESRMLYAWLTEMHRDSGIIIEKAFIRRNEDAPTLRVQVTLRQGGGA